ncbi:MAG: hypothetical protein IKH15_08005 [Bacteroidales bacterium]|nr:hypothetical protein [Bacteroidales bacterium]MBR4637027.1 hypothetical protein [Bacteroidales bacterium]
MDSTLYEEVGRLARKWRKYPNVYDPTDPDNRTKLIEKNLKMAINVALQYRGLGLSEEELISAAFEGLATAYLKYDPSKAVTRDRILAEITDDTTSEEFLAIVEKHVKYGEVSDLFAKGLPQNPTEMREWVTKNIKPAKFSSTAFFWVRACVLSDLERYSKPLRVAESYKVPDQFQSLDDGDMYFSEKITYTEQDPEEIEEAYQKLYNGVPDYCLNILFMRNGVGYDGAMTLREIADLHGRTVGEIKNILSATEDKMRDNIRRYKLKINDLIVL